MRALTAARTSGIISSDVGAWRSLVAHLLWEQGVARSSRVAPTTFLPSASRRLTASWLMRTA